MMATTAEQILDRAIAIGTEKSNLANTAASAAMTAAQGFTLLEPATVGPMPPVIEPLVNIPYAATGVDHALYGSTYDKIIGDLAGKFAQFFTDYFPVDPLMMQAAQDWITATITQGGSGINAQVEDQFWQRDRDRITRAGAAAEVEAVLGWAAKGFPLPPGAANATIIKIRRDRDAKIYEQSRDRAIKTFDTEIENVKFAVGQAIDYRVKAISAAGDYIRALALAPQIAATLSTAAASAQANLINAAASFYNARIRVAELKFTPARLNAEMSQQMTIKQGDSFDNSRNLMASTTASVASSLGTQAASALNAVNATTQIIQQVEAAA